MKKTISVLFLAAASFLIIGCGGGEPTKDEVCSGCTDTTAKGICELGFDACEEQSNCDLSEYKKGIEDSGVCK